MVRLLSKKVNVQKAVIPRHIGGCPKVLLSYQTDIPNRQIYPAKVKKRTYFREKSLFSFSFPRLIPCLHFTEYCIFEIVNNNWEYLLLKIENKLFPWILQKKGILRLVNRHHCWFWIYLTDWEVSRLRQLKNQPGIGGGFLQTRRINDFWDNCLLVQLAYIRCFNHRLFIICSPKRQTSHSVKYNPPPKKPKQSTNYIYQEATLIVLR